MTEIVSIEKAVQFVEVFFGGCIIVIGAIMLDLWDGVYTARALGNKVHSHKLRVTVEKMSEYWRFVMIGFLVDCMGLLFSWYGLPYLTLLFCAGLVGVEIKSMFEHAKKRKTSTTELAAIIGKIVECATEKDAKRILTQIIGDLDEKNIQSEKDQT